METLLYKLRFVTAGMFILASVFLLALLVSAIGGGNSSTSASTFGNSYDSPNAVTGGMAVMLDDFSRTADSAASSITSAAHSLTSGSKSAVDSTATAMANSGKFVGNGLLSGLALGGHVMGNAASFSAHTFIGSTVYISRSIGGVFGYISNTPVVRAAIKPADSMTLPVIDVNASSLAAAHTALPTAQPAVHTAVSIDETPQWPMHGAITTLFWASDWPYQVHHTGIDISDGQPSGVTPLHPFKPGKVIDVIHSNVSLGNHVIVDHGNGMTSVYGHMYATSVAIGQTVDKSTVLGYEGSTGASTGPHVHFEIRINNEPVNPSLYVPGQP